MHALILSAALAATLPGIPVEFDVDDNGSWKLPDDLSDGLKAAGAKPGWELVEIDGLAFDDPALSMRQVASGPSRTVRVLVADPRKRKGKEAMLVAKRAPLVHLEVATLTEWPERFSAPAKQWENDWTGTPVLIDSDGKSWRFDTVTGALDEVETGDWTEAMLPDVFWNLADAAWAIDDGESVTVQPMEEARKQLTSTARIEGFLGMAGDHLVAAEADGLKVWAIEWPRGTSFLPTCQPFVPESCLTAGMHILSEMSARPGAVEEARRQLGVACANGVHRACYEAVALEAPDLSPRVNECVAGDVAACTEVAEAQFELDPENPDDLVVGLLEFSCQLEGSGTLGQRLRRLENVGAGCMLLSKVYDLKGVADQALLNLDQACVLGRADACEEATERRHLAYANRTVRECEDPDVPIASACVELGVLLQEGEVPSSSLDDFGAFLAACSLGDISGCILLGDYVDRWGIDNQRVKKAENELEDSCKEGEQRACVGAGHLLVRHEPRTEEYGRALLLFDRACEAGLGEACVAGAQQRRIGYARKVEAPDQSTMWTSACEKHDASGCAGLGERMSRSKSEWGNAFTAWNHACDLGDASSCSDLGQLVERKHDAWEGEQPAESYLQRGCTNGDPRGCYWLAEEDVQAAKKSDPPEDAYLLLAQSCEGEWGEGCAELAEVHLNRKTSFDDEIAARHLDTACANGNFDSCRVLGSMYLSGKGVERDRRKAKEFYERFRFNAQRKHIRIGAVVGAPQLAGAELELVAPIPVGPAISVNGSYSYVPGIGSALMVLEGDNVDEPPALQTLTGNARLYPNTQARGFYATGGFHSHRTVGGEVGDKVVQDLVDTTGGFGTETEKGEAVRSRSGLSGGIGLRNQTRFLYTDISIGFGTYGTFDLANFTNQSDAKLPVVLPSMSFGIGFAFL